MPIKFLTKSELERFFVGIRDHRDQALFATIYHYGLRVSEATLIKLTYVDSDQQTIYNPWLKGGISGRKPLLPSAATLLTAYLRTRQPTGDALFTGRQGNLKRHRIGQLFRRYAHQADLWGYSLHCLRHSIATHLYQAGFRDKEIRDYLGHMSIQSTMIYTHLIEGHFTELSSLITARTDRSSDRLVALSSTTIHRPPVPPK